MKKRFLIHFQTPNGNRSPSVQKKAIRCANTKKEAIKLINPRNKILKVQRLGSKFMVK